MSEKDGAPPKRNKKAITAPGFGAHDPLRPIEVTRTPITVDDEPAPPPSQPQFLAMEQAPPSGIADISHAAPMLAAASARRVSTPAVDIDLVHETRSAPLPDTPWTFLEIWTRNTIYALDSRLFCIDVLDQGTKRSLLDHPLRGARLVGGQVREGDAMELSHPFPRPGSEAVFEQAQGRHVRFSQTSSVTRVVMRLRVLTVTPDQLLPTWEEVTGQHSREALRGKR
jgi:hypothetical protein